MENENEWETIWILLQLTFTGVPLVVIALLIVAFWIHNGGRDLDYFSRVLVELLLVYFAVVVGVRVVYHIVGRIRKFGFGANQFFIVVILFIPVVTSILIVCCLWCNDVQFVVIVGLKELYCNFVVVMVLYLVVRNIDYVLIPRGGFVNQMELFLVPYPFPLSYFKVKYQLDINSFRKLKQSVWQAIFVRVIGTIIQITLKIYGVKLVQKIWIFDIDLISLAFFVLYLASSIVAGSGVKLLCKATPSDLLLDKFWDKLTFTILVLDILLIQEFVFGEICGFSHLIQSVIVIIEMQLLATKNVFLFPVRSSYGLAEKGHLGSHFE